jgi:hypothetical protein
MPPAPLRVLFTQSVYFSPYPRVSELLGESAAEYDELVHPVGYAVQRALMSYAGANDATDLG